MRGASDHYKGVIRLEYHPSEPIYLLEVTYPQTGQFGKVIGKGSTIDAAIIDAVYRMTK